MSNHIIYNVTVNIDLDIHDEWLEWMRDIHIPDVMKTGHFIDYRLSRIIGESEGGISYSIMYMARDMHSLNEYKKHHASSIQKEHTEKYQGKFAAFRTLLEVIDHG